MPVPNSSSYPRWIFLLLTGILLFLTFNRHSRSGSFNYHSEIWADKAGYYVYLPATFIYGFDARKFPDSIAEKTGNGFRLENNGLRVITKYSCGVAIMQLPFFLAAHILAPSLGQPRDGFTPVYHKAINVAAVVYLMLGLWLLWRILSSTRTGRYAAPLSLFLILTGTNLFYYGISDTGMSHVYSFFLFCACLFLLHRTQYLHKVSLRQWLLLGLVCGLIVLVRPVNLLFLTALLFIDAADRQETRDRLKRLWQWPVLIPMTMAALVFLPQLLYNRYAFGDAIFYTYGEEGFQWLQPQILKTWFAPNNGLFLYSPLWFMLLYSVYAGYRAINRRYFFGLFLVLSYVLSCWWDRSFGCSFGARSFVEYGALFCLPLHQWLQRLHTWPRWKKAAIFALLFLAVGYNLKMIYSFDSCFYGVSDWDWSAYFKWLLSPVK